MKKIWKFLVHHLKEDFNTPLYVTVALFLTACMAFNYSVDFEDSFLDGQTGFRKFLYFFLFFSTAYFFVLLACSFFGKEKKFWTRKEFWIKSMLGLGAIGLDSSAPFIHSLIRRSFAPELYLWIYKLSVNILSIFLILLPLLIYYFLCDRKQKHVYGLSARQFDTRPYFIMLAIMFPLIVMVSFLPAFIRQYPMYKGTDAAAYLNISEWITVSAYEFVYGLDFVTVEFFFRGFLVIGMMGLLGRSAVLAMAATYCFLHFGKPAGEAISSIFGGYILGVIAYETKSIWGGIIVHVGIAWMMELVAFIQKSF